MKRAPRSPRERAREARLAVYRQHILEAAEEVFAEKGIAAASMQEIARKAAVSVGTIYSVFRSKEEVLQAILETRGSEILELVRKASAREGSAAHAMLDLLRDYVEYFSARPYFLRMHLRLGAAWMYSPENGAGKRAAVWTEIQQLQASIFARGTAEGTFVDGPPLLLARLFSAVNQTLLADWVEGGMRTDSGTLFEEVSGWVKRLVWRDPDQARMASKST